MAIESNSAMCSDETSEMRIKTENEQISALAIQQIASRGHLQFTVQLRHSEKQCLNLKKYFKKYLPTQESIHQNRFIGLFGTTLHHHNLWHLNRRSTAGGVAVGMFTGLIPGPFQMIGAAICSVIFKVNLPVAVFTTLYTNPFTIVPLYVVAYALGRLVTGTSGVNALSIHDIEVEHWYEWIPALFHWMTSMGKPFALGLFLLACLLALIGYFSVRWGWRIHVLLALRKRKLRHQPK